MRTLLFVLLAVGALAAQPRIAPEDARAHAGKRVTVCGKVTRAYYAVRAKGRPTFLTLGERGVTLVIWDRDRPKWERAPESHLHGELCATGTVRLYRGQAQMTVRKPAVKTAIKTAINSWGVVRAAPASG
jgi:hypothetical protein